MIFDKLHTVYNLMLSINSCNPFVCKDFHLRNSKELTNIKNHS